MLSLPEKITFILATLASLAATGLGVRRLARLIGAGYGNPDWRLARKRLGQVVGRLLAFQPVFRFRFWTSLFHAFVGWGFVYYISVNLFDLIHAYDGEFFIPGVAGDVCRLLADVVSVAVLIGMAFLIVRRFIVRPSHLSTRGSTFLHPKARRGIRRDSAIVAGFILAHVGARFTSASLAVAAVGHADGWQPFASVLAGRWPGAQPETLVLGQHIAFWLALGSVLLFLPYFPYSKHVHLFFAPLNYLLKPPRRSMGEMSFQDLNDPTLERFGVSTMQDLGWEQLMDAYACIMCYRCQEVCPAYQTGKLLSPAALEINKRYLLNSVGSALPVTPMIEAVILQEAIWACTACAACVDICPVGDEPMRDILDIRRALSLMENAFPKQLEAAFRGMERAANPWGVPASERMRWAEGLPVPTIGQNPHPEVLWWVGCAPATEIRARRTARAFAQILDAAGVDYAVLGQDEQCTGDAARRAGREDIFFTLARANVDRLDAVRAHRIVTTCPHCLHVLKNEYPAFGGHYQVLHHSQLILELIQLGKLGLDTLDEGILDKVTYHDPCYLGRQNGIIDAPRRMLAATGVIVNEMPHHGMTSFCCGAGGAQMWREEEHGTQRISAVRLAEARATGAATLAVACPFCLAMLSDAANSGSQQMDVMDLAEIVASRLPGATTLSG